MSKLDDALARGGPCEACRTMPDAIDCPVCGAAAFLVHPFRAGVGHWHACQACTRREVDLEREDHG